MKVKKKVSQAGLQLNIKETKVMTTEEIHDFNTDNEDTEMVKDFTSSGHSIQVERQLRNHERAKIWNGSDRIIRKGHQEHRCVIRDQG